MVSGCRNCWHKVSRDKEQWSFCPIAENETAGKYWPEENESYRTAFARTQYRYCRTPTIQTLVTWMPNIIQIALRKYFYF